MKGYTSKTTKRLTLLALLTALSLVAFTIESLLPPLPVPGAKVGLSNVFSLFALVTLGPIDSLLLVVVKCTLGSIFSGNVSAVLYSLTAGLGGVLLATLLLRLPLRFSLVAVSVCSAVLHNFLQLVVFWLMTGSSAVWGYFPYLSLIGALSGAVVGIVVHFVVRSIPISTFEKILQNPSGGQVHESNQR